MSGMLVDQTCMRRGGLVSFKLETRPSPETMMITFPCDKCEKELRFAEERVGEKVECPFCGDINRIPSASMKDDAPSGGVLAPEPLDRAAAAGLPPDDGPEETVMLIRPSIFQAHPFSAIGLVIAPPAVFIVMKFVFGTEWSTAGGALLGAIALAWVPLFIWWLTATMGVMLKVTNKRTIERRGLLRRATSEVLHDHVRNIQIDQSFLNRILGVGHVGISSSGQDGIEIQIRNIPKPDRMKDVIDKYRPM